MVNKLLFLGLAILVVCACQRKDLSYPLVEVPNPNTDFYESAITEVERRVQSNPNNPDAHFKKAIYLEALGDSEGSLAAIRQAITLDATPEYLMKEAELLMILEDYESALNSVSRAQLLGGDYPDLWHLLARLNYRQGAFELALTQVDKALQKHPKGTQYHLIKGQTQWVLHDTLGAISSLQKAKEHEDVRYQALKELVALNKAAGDYESAFEYLLQNRQEQKGDLNLIFVQGQLLKETAQFDSALSVFNYLSKFDSSDFRPFFESSLIHFDVRRYDSALYYSDKVLALKPDHLPAMLTKARVYDRRTYYSSALKSYQAILAIDSTYTPAAEELEKLNGKIAYLQRIRQSRERNAGLRILTPKPTKDSN